MNDILTRLSRLEGALVAAPPPAGGPATRIKSDYAGGGGGKGGGGGGSKGGGRKVASKAGEKRYGLPIGTPLGQTKSAKKGDVETQRSYEAFQAASTPADQRRVAGWMSTADLERSAEALFSFDSDNERDQSARIALVRELADRGIDPHRYGYRGGPVTLNPKPKPDPVAKAADDAKKAADRESAKAVREAEAAKRKAETEQRKAEADRKRAEAEGKKAERDAADKAETDARKQLGKAIAEGLIDERQAQERMAETRRRLKTG